MQTGGQESEQPRYGTSRFGRQARLCADRFKAWEFIGLESVQIEVDKENWPQICVQEQKRFFPLSPTLALP
jgi:hypothetical protein